MDFCFLVKIRPLNNSIFLIIKNPFQLLHVLSASSVQGGLESDTTGLLSAQSLFGVPMMSSGCTCQEGLTSLRQALLQVALLVTQWTTNVLRTLVTSLYSQLEGLE